MGWICSPVRLAILRVGRRSACLFLLLPAPPDDEDLGKCSFKQKGWCQQYYFRHAGGPNGGNGWGLPDTVFPLDQQKGIGIWFLLRWGTGVAPLRSGIASRTEAEGRVWSTCSALRSAYPRLISVIEMRPRVGKMLEWKLRQVISRPDGARPGPGPTGYVQFVAGTNGLTPIFSSPVALILRLTGDDRSNAGSGWKKDWDSGRRRFSRITRSSLGKTACQFFCCPDRTSFVLFQNYSRSPATINFFLKLTQA